MPEYVGDWKPAEHGSGLVPTLSQYDTKTGKKRILQNVDRALNPYFQLPPQQRILQNVDRAQNVDSSDTEAEEGGPEQSSNPLGITPWKLTSRPLTAFDAGVNIGRDNMALAYNDQMKNRAKDQPTPDCTETFSIPAGGFKRFGLELPSDTNSWGTDQRNMALGIVRATGVLTVALPFAKVTQNPSLSHSLTVLIPP